jgi:hypothetical protein
MGDGYLTVYSSASCNRAQIKTAKYSDISMYKKDIPLSLAFQGTES